MAIPTYDEFIYPALEILAKHRKGIEESRRLRSRRQPRGPQG